MNPIDIISNVAATFLGAWAAFRLDSWKEERSTKEKRVAAINSAIFSICLQVSQLGDIRKAVIDPVRESPVRHIEMRAVLGYKAEAIETDIDTLSFLLETDHRDFLLEYLVERNRFNSVMAALEERSELHVKEIQPKLESVGFLEGRPIAIAEIDAVLGQRLLSTLLRLTDDVVTGIDKAIASHMDFAERFRAAARKQFPRSTIIGVAPSVSSKEHSH